MTPQQLTKFALDFHGWYTGKEKSDLKPCLENVEIFAERWMKQNPVISMPGFSADLNNSKIDFIKI
jgi:hypothetical protein